MVQAAHVLPFGPMDVHVLVVVEDDATDQIGDVDGYADDDRVLSPTLDPGRVLAAGSTAEVIVHIRT